MTAVHLEFEPAQVRWPATPDGQYARNYLSPMMEHGVSQFIRNVTTRLGVLTVDDIILPVTINNAEYDNSYVCSPYTQYITYAGEELQTLHSPWLEVALRALLKAVGGVLKYCRINRVVIVNNWLLSTNLYPPLTYDQVRLIRNFLTVRYPGHAIVFRSVHNATPGGPLQALRLLGFALIGSRQSYMFDSQATMGWRVNKTLRRDRTLLENSDYRVDSELTPEDAGRIVELYGALYLDKYSILNPQFTERFVRLSLQSDGPSPLHLHAFRRAGRIDAISGFFIRHGVMTTPLFGYDTTIEQHAGLYRLLSAQLVAEATSRQILLHQSSGAASFKRWRGGVPFIEYNAVFHRHVSRRQQAGWTLLRALVQTIAVPLLKRFRL